MTHEVLMEVNEGKQIADLGGVEEPLIFVEYHIRHRVEGVLLEDAISGILLRVGDVGRIDDDGVDEGDGG